MLLGEKNLIEFDLLTFRQLPGRPCREFLLQSSYPFAQLLDFLLLLGVVLLPVHIHSNQLNREKEAQVIPTFQASQQAQK